MVSRGLPTLIQPIKEGALSGRVFDIIRKAIFAGEFKPGQILREIHLAKQLGVSQATVRQALLQLEHTGLVNRLPGRETIVTRLTTKDIRERVGLRVLLEGLACVAAARRMERGHFKELDHKLADLQEAVCANAYFDAAMADLAFHAFVWRQSGNDNLSRILEQLTAPMFAFASLSRSRRREDLKRTLSSHEEIVAALKGGQEQEIKEVIRLHIERPYEGFLRMRNSDPDLGPEDEE
jgi:DNA-binding GntR family transcriptional regulator